MYGQNARLIMHKKHGRRYESKKTKTDRKETRRLCQLGVCLLLFFTVFIGKGVFPERLEQASEKVLALIGQNTDFRGAFAGIGEALKEHDSIIGEMGAFCVEVFGAKESEVEWAVDDMEPQAKAEQRFLNSGADHAQVAAHYLRMEEIPQAWYPKLEDVVKTEEPTATSRSGSEVATPAVGTVLLDADYQGPELPEGYTMDQLSLGGLDTVTPVLGPIWSEYGYRDHPIDGAYKFHNGIDIGAEKGAAIGAFAAGSVEYIGENDTHGYYLQIDHGDGIKSFYAHCSQLCVEQGQKVSAGEKVAEVGSTGTATGPHLHLELKCAGVHIDPAYYIQRQDPA